MLFFSVPSPYKVFYLRPSVIDLGIGTPKGSITLCIAYNLTVTVSDEIHNDFPLVGGIAPSACD